MKTAVLLIVLAFCVFSLKAQTPANPAEDVANKIATKMKDSLGLTDTQRTEVYAINMNLHTQKQNARELHTGNAQATAAAVQNIEKTRDSLYQTVLTAAQFTIYKQKKRFLINVN
jgi:hypothetical protein